MKSGRQGRWKENHIYDGVMKEVGKRREGNAMKTKQGAVIVKNEKKHAFDVDFGDESAVQNSVRKMRNDSCVIIDETNSNQILRSFASYLKGLVCFHCERGYAGKDIVEAESKQTRRVSLCD